MTNSFKENAFTTLVIAAVLGAAIGLIWGLAHGVRAVVMILCDLVVAICHGIIAFLPHLAVMWVTVVGQVLACLGGAAFTLWLAGRMYAGMTVRFDQLAREHKEALKAARKRTPPLVLAAGLIGQTALIVPGVVFGENKFMALAVTGILTLTFWVANEFLIRDSKPSYWFGLLLWVVAVCALPFLIVMNAGGFDAFLKQLSSHWDLGITCLLLTLIACALPFLSLPDKGEED